MKLDGYGLRWFSANYKSQQTALRQETLPAYSYKYVCQRQKLTAADAQDARCVVGADSTAAPRALLWGDSNAAHYVGMFGAFANQDDYRFRNLAVGSCPPIFGDPKAFYLCPQGACSAFDQSGRPSYYDARHLSMPASWALGKRILQQGGVPPPFDLIAPK